MTLKTALDEFRAEFLTKVPAAIAATMEQATLQLTQDYASNRLLQVGDYALILSCQMPLENPCD